MTLTDKIAALLAADPACNGRVTGETVRAIAGLEWPKSERYAIADWLRKDAAKTRQDLRGMHARRQLTIGQTAEWENLINLKAGLADAIERGDFGAGGGEISMKILNDIAAAISTELRYLSRVEVMTPIGREIPADQKTAPLVRMFHDTDIPTRILRLEIEEGGEAHKALWREHVIDRDSPSRHKFMGVAIYYVRDINSWRLVNPFKE